MTATYNFILNQGSDKTLRFVIKSMLAYYCQKVYKRIQLNGYSAAMQLRKFVEDQDAVLTLTTSNGKLMIEENIGYLTAYFSNEDTGSLEAGDYVYDLEIQMQEENKVYRILEGTVTVSPEVTKVNG